MPLSPRSRPTFCCLRPMVLTSLYPPRTAFGAHSGGGMIRPTRAQSLRCFADGALDTSAYYTGMRVTAHIHEAIGWSRPGKPVVAAHVPCSVFASSSNTSASSAA